jgi:uncharacterized coiled-coil protein SlyX
MRVPAVRRVMVRLANLEDAIARQQASLDALDGYRERSSADQVGHVACLAGLESELARQRASLDALDDDQKRLRADQADQTDRGARLEQAAAVLHDRLKEQQAQAAALRDAVQIQKAQIDQLLDQVRRLGADSERSSAVLAEVAQHLPPAQRANLETTLHGQQLQLGALNATVNAQQMQLAALNDSVAGVAEHLSAARQANLETTLHGQQLQLGALNSTVNAQQMQLAALNDGMAGVAEHLSAARQANLEATLHGQQLQLGALNSTVNAQQMQLAALNDLVRRATSEPEAKPAHQPASTEAARQGRPARPAVSPFTFDQLLNQEVEKLDLDLVFNIHVPKAAGNSTNLLFRHLGFIPLMLDMNSNDFFQMVREDRWFEGYEAPAPRVAAYLMTGHMRLDHPIFRRLWIPHLIVSMLRDPLERMMSHYNFTLRLPDNPWHAEVVSRRMSFLEYAGKMLDAIGPQYSFFDDTGCGTFARTGTASARDCLSNLLTKVSFYGLCDRFDEFAVMSGYLLGRRSFLAVAPVNVTGEIEDLGGGVPPKTTLTDQERDGLTTMLGNDIWFYQQAAKEYEKRVADSRLQALFAQMLPVVKSSREAMRGVLTIRDPADPGRRAFARARRHYSVFRSYGITE